MVCQPATAQRDKKPIAVDTVAFFRGVAVSGDLAGAVMNLVSDYGQYEAALRVNLKDRYFPIIELGIGQADHTDDGTNIRFKTTAPYGRIGMDFNILRNKHDDYRLYAGARLAYTSFEYDIAAPPVTDPVWGGVASYGQDGVKGNYMWMEAVLGVDAKIWGPLHMGWSFRYRAKISGSMGSIGKAWYVPGFGRSGGTRLGATFNVEIDI